MSKLLQRESNFELLRIVSMIFIILYHLVLYGNYQVNDIFSFNNIVLTCFMSGGKLGVILFVMITGYYMVNARELKLKKLLILELQVLFYSIGLLLVFKFLGNRAVTLNELSKLLFPNLLKTYWFFSSYFILYLCIPYLNKLILVLDKKEFEKLLIIGFVFLVLVPSVVIYNKEISQGIYLFFYYMVGAYIKMFGEQIRGGKRYLLGFIFCYFLITLITVYIRYLSFSNNILMEYVYSFSRISSILIFGSAVCLFLFFKGLRIGRNWLINLMSSVSFGVYLFHEHIFMRELLWGKLFNVSRLVNSGCVLGIGLVVAMGIYIFGGILELGGQVMFKYFGNIMKKVGIKF